MEAELKHFGDVRTVKELIQHITSRPETFSATGTFNETVAWLNGFRAGIGVTGGPASDIWEGFIHWLPLHLGYAENYWWPTQIRVRYPDDSDAHKQLMLLFDEYMSNRGNPDAR